MHPRRLPRGLRLVALGAVACVVLTLIAVSVGAGLGRGAPVALAASISVPVTVSVMPIVDTGRWTPARGWYPAQPQRELPATIYRPAVAGTWPVVAFAHGFAANPGSYDTLLSRLASAGYVVVAPSFPGSRDDAPGSPTQADLGDEPTDLSIVLNVVLASGNDPASPLFGAIDASRVGAVGHSDGGIAVTAMALGAAHHDPRLSGTAVLAGTIGIPDSYAGNTGAVLVVTGTADSYNSWWSARRVYDAARAPRGMITVPGGTHTGPFLDAGAQADATRASIVDFLDATVRRDPSGLVRLGGDTAGAGLTFEQDGLTPVPLGSLDVVATTPAAGLRVAGWALDPGVAGPIAVHVYVDGAGFAILSAGASRPDVAAGFSDVGPLHGFDVVLAGFSDGSHSVCVFAIGIGTGNNTAFGCRSVTISRNPFGSFDAVVAAPLEIGGGRVAVQGWALDPDTTASIDVHVYIDGGGPIVATAAGDRGDVDAAFGLGATHGYDVDVPGLGHGTHSACVYAMNVGAGMVNMFLGCRAFLVGRDPLGAFDTASAVPGGVAVGGWALDPDTVAPIDVHVYVDGLGYPMLASGDRGDIAAAFAAYGPAHGFVAAVPATPGPHTVCAYGINVGAGAINTLLGCRAV